MSISNLTGTHWKLKSNNSITAMSNTTHYFNCRTNYTVSAGTYHHSFSAYCFKINVRYSNKSISSLFTSYTHCETARVGVDAPFPAWSASRIAYSRYINNYSGDLYGGLVSSAVTTSSTSGADVSVSTSSPKNVVIFTFPSYSNNTGIIDIIDGEDATNSNLISWFENNCNRVLSVTKNLSHITSSNSSSYFDDNNSWTTVLTPQTGYELPTEITVTGCTASYNSSTGELTLSNPTDEVTITGSGIESIAYDLTQLQLSAGTHTIRVAVQAAGYRDSEFSNSVSYVVASGYNVSITYTEDGGHANENYVGYSLDNGATYTKLIYNYQSPTITLNDISQIKFKAVKNGYQMTGDGITITFNGTTILDIPYDSDTTAYSDNIILSANSTATVSNRYQCFAENTKIKLADGTDKLVQDITYDDELLVWDFYEGKLAKAKPCWIKITQSIGWYNKITLDNGTVLRLVGPKGHRLFSIDKQQMLYSNEIVGHRVYTLDGIATVVACERVEEEVKFYNLTTEKYLDCFAENVLTGSRLNNMYHISDMKYDSDVRLISEEEEAER